MNHLPPPHKNTGFILVTLLLLMLVIAVMTISLFNMSLTQLQLTKNFQKHIAYEASR